MIFDEYFTLQNGVKIPKLGLGTWFIDDNKATQAVCDAVEIGYRHIDTAQAYGNEKGVGDGIKACGVPRNEIFVTTKLAAEAKSYDEAANAIDDSLEKLGLDFIDLMLIHAPQPWADFRGGDYSDGNREAWRALENAYKTGKIRSIGISNFKKEDIDNIISGCTVKPMVNQLLVHISNTPEQLIAYSKECGMTVEAYSPIAHGKILNTPLIVDMAKKYNVTVPQLCIRYTIQLETISLPKASSPEHMSENADINFAISNEDMEILKNAEHIKDYGDCSVFPVFSGK